MGRDTDYFKVGGVVGFSGRLKLPPLPLIYFSADLGYSLAPLEVETSLNLLSFGAGAGISYKIIPGLNI